jgi:hypothetical protein
VDETLRLLEQTDAVTRSADTPPVYLPAHAPEDTPVASVLDGARRIGEKSAGALRFGLRTNAITATLERLDTAIASAFDQISVKDLALDIDRSDGGRAADVLGDAPTPLIEGARRTELAE